MTSNPLPKHGPHKAGTVGRPQGSVQVAILDDKCQKVRIYSFACTPLKSNRRDSCAVSAVLADFAVSKQRWTFGDSCRGAACRAGESYDPL
jgi:hypothetical protein